MSDISKNVFHHRFVRLLNKITEINSHWWRLQSESKRLKTWNFELHFFWTPKPTKNINNIWILILRVDISPVNYCKYLYPESPQCLKRNRIINLKKWKIILELIEIKTEKSLKVCVNFLTVTKYQTNCLRIFLKKKMTIIFLRVNFNEARFMKRIKIRVCYTCMTLFLNINLITVLKVIQTLIPL